MTMAINRGIIYSFSAAILWALSIILLKFILNSGENV
jgi:hypothetical protein